MLWNFYTKQAKMIVGTRTTGAFEILLLLSTDTIVVAGSSEARFADCRLQFAIAATAAAMASCVAKQLPL